MQYWEEQDFTRRFDMRVWRHVLAYARPYYRHLALIALTMMVCAGIDVLFPLFTREAIGPLCRGRYARGAGLFALKYFLAVVAQAGTVLVFCELSSRVEIGCATASAGWAFANCRSFPSHFTTARAWATCSRA